MNNKYLENKNPSIIVLYCSEHALKNTLTRNKHGSKYPPPKSAEALLLSLSHYVKKPRKRSNSSSTQHSDDGERFSADEGDLKVSRSQDPFVDLDACSIYNDRCSQILDFCSESESDIEASTYSSVWHDAQADSSGDESIDSEQEDVLKHANVYTAEEITRMTRDKLVRLHALYIEQYRHLQYLLKEKRRKYLHSLKREKETCCNIYNQVRDNPKEQRLYKKLKALNSYHKCHGTDAILNKRLKDLRMKVSEGITPKIHMHTKCSFSEGGVKCTERSIPLSKFCQKHILEDHTQVLFRACGKLTGDMTCPTPIAAVFDDSTCPLHLDIPPLRSYSVLRKDSESDIEDTSDAHLNYSHLSENVKTEFMHYDIPPEIPKMEKLPSMLFEEYTRSPNESSNDFTFKQDSYALEEAKAMQSDESMDEINVLQVNEEVEISTEVNESLASVSGNDIKTETVDVNDMVIVDEGVVEIMETAMDTSMAEELDVGEVETVVSMDSGMELVKPSEVPGTVEHSEDVSKAEILETGTDMAHMANMIETAGELENTNPDIEKHETLQEKLESSENETSSSRFDSTVDNVVKDSIPDSEKTLDIKVAVNSKPVEAEYNEDGGAEVNTSDSVPEADEISSKNNLNTLEVVQNDKPHSTEVIGGEETCFQEEENTVNTLYKAV
nr:uncharacterized protein LOC111508826 [Leptinotarsa decemlineata]